MRTPNSPQRRPLTEAEVLSQIEVADAAMPTSEPTATRIDFDPESHRFTMYLTGGTSVGFDAASLWELKGATVADLSSVELSPSGSAITWPSLDMDISVDGLVLDLLGSPEWRRSLRRNLNRELASAKSKAKTLAARENGKKGGRPRKIAAI